MKVQKCTNCGSGELLEEGGYWLCAYCGSKFAIEAADVPQKGMGVSLNEDINILLNKCRTDPRNARKLANLILDIDPTNQEALKYL